MFFHQRIKTKHMNKSVCSYSHTMPDKLGNRVQKRKDFSKIRWRGCSKAGTRTQMPSPPAQISAFLTSACFPCLYLPIGAWGQAVPSTWTATLASWLLAPLPVSTPSAWPPHGCHGDLVLCKSLCFLQPFRCSHSRKNGVHTPSHHPWGSKGSSLNSQACFSFLSLRAYFPTRFKGLQWPSPNLSPW